MTASRDFVLCLRWTCEACGWSMDINAPGFAGDGRLHYPDGKTACGPIGAQRADAPVVIRDATPLQRASSPTRVLIDGVPIEQTPDEPGPLLRQREAGGTSPFPHGPFLRPEIVEDEDGETL